MGVAEAIVISSLVTAGAAVATSSMNKGGSKPKTAPQYKTDTVPEDLKKKKSARAAVLSGDPEGILTPAATSGRGRLLGN